MMYILRVPVMLALAVAGHYDSCETIEHDFLNMLNESFML